MELLPTEEVINRFINIVEEVKSLVLNKDIERFDGAVSKIKDIIEALNLVPKLEWVNNVISQLSELLLIFENLISDYEECRNSNNNLSISKKKLEFLLEKGFKVSKISVMLGISKRTTFRKMKSFGLSVKSYYTLLKEDELVDIIRSILAAQPNTGIKRMKGHLQSRNIRTKELQLRRAMRLADPIGVYNRTIERNSTIRRRQYYVKYSNQIWHLDANLKLNRWGFVIRGGIDGKSRAAMYLKVSSDNRADSHLISFMEGVRQFGIPLRTRTDKGKENILIAQFMIQNRGTGVSAHICGRSVHNQRIERFWRDVSYGCTSTYYNVFHALEDDGWLNPENPKHIYLLHKIFIPRINNSLKEFMEGWNNHPISTEKNQTPLQIWMANLPPQHYDIQFSQSDDLANLTSEDVFDHDSFVGYNDITSPPALVNLLDEDENLKLNDINLAKLSLSFGYDVFRECVVLLN